MEKVSTIIRSRYAYYLGIRLREYAPARRPITEKDF